MSEQKSKTTLLEYEKNLDIIQNAEGILEQKRNILLNDILDILDDVEEKRDKLNELVKKSYSLLIKSFMENEKDVIKKEASLINFQGELKVVKKTFIGIEIPDVIFKVNKEKFPISATAETLFLDIAKESFAKALELVLEVARIEIKAWKLSEELKKTVVHVNALKNHYIPNYEKEIKDIKTSLEENEREFLTVLKKVSSHKSQNL